MLHLFRLSVLNNGACQCFCSKSLSIHLNLSFIAVVFASHLSLTEESPLEFTKPPTPLIALDLFLRLEIGKQG